MKTIKIFIVLVVIALAGAAGYVYSGAYDIGADRPHWPPVFWLLQTFRARSIEEHAVGVQVPKLDDAALIAEGAEHYAAMCSGCHLAPGMEETEIRKGLYPQPPKLAEPWPANPAEQFWAIKHGIKMTAMPAWGASHDDEAIWGLVAFLQKLPELSPDEYRTMTAKDSGHRQAHDHGDHGHKHGA